MTFTLSGDLMVLEEFTAIKTLLGTNTDFQTSKLLLYSKKKKK